MSQITLAQSYRLCCSLSLHGGDGDSHYSSILRALPNLYPSVITSLRHSLALYSDCSKANSRGFSDEPHLNAVGNETQGP